MRMRDWIIEGGLVALLCVCAISALLLLVGCSTPATRTETVEVKIPVATKPLKPEQIPTAPAPLGPRPQSLSAAADVLLADHCAWVAFGLKAMPLLQLSAGISQQPLPTYKECEH